MFSVFSGWMVLFISKIFWGHEQTWKVSLSCSNISLCHVLLKILVFGSPFFLLFSRFCLFNVRQLLQGVVYVSWPLLALSFTLLFEKTPLFLCLYVSNSPVNLQRFSVWAVLNFSVFRSIDTEGWSWFWLLMGEVRIDTGWQFITGQT